MLPLEPFPIGAEGAQSRPEGGNLSLIHGAVLVTWVAVTVAPGAVSADEPGEAHAIVEAGTSHGAVVGTWERRQSYSLSLLRLGELGQGSGARLTLVPPPHLTGNWGLSADAVGRWANEGPLYVKPMGGIALAAPNALWPPRIRAGAEVGLTAIRGWIGLEAGVTVVYAFPPSRALEGEWVISAGMGILFGFGAPSSTPVASRSDVRSGEQPFSSANPVMGTVLGATPMGGFNTCEGSKATPQCLQAMSQSEGTASASATSPPTPGTTTSTAAPAGSTTSSTVPTAAPSTTSIRLPAKPLGIIGSIWAALMGPSDEQRREQAEHDRLMLQSERALEERKLELPNSKPNTPMREPSGSTAPRIESENRTPRSAPSPSEDHAIAEPDGELQSALELHNPHGQHGRPDHKATVERLVELAKREFPINAEIRTGKSIYEYTHVNRRPDVWVLDGVTKKVLKVYEGARFNSDGSLPRREQQKKEEYDRAGIPSHFEPVKP